MRDGEGERELHREGEGLGRERVCLDESIANHFPYPECTSLYSSPQVFDVTQLPVVEYAQSLGLLTAPKLRFLKKVLLCLLD